MDWARILASSLKLSAKAIKGSWAAGRFYHWYSPILLGLAPGASGFFDFSRSCERTEGQLPELQRVIAAYGDRVVMKETLAEALSDLFELGAAQAPPRAAKETPLPTAATDRVREALDHYNRAIERLKSGDWAGFGTELDAMRGLLEDLSQQSRGDDSSFGRQ
jgi:hypothetical protein